MTNIPLIKRTKQEILDAYEELQEKFEDIRSSAKTVHSQPSLELVSKAKEQNPQTIENAFTDFQRSLHERISELRTTMLNRSRELQDLLSAIELSKKDLEVTHGITVCAESLDILTEEQKKRTAQHEEEMKRKSEDFDEQMIQKKKAWEREGEEYAYTKKIQRERDVAEIHEREKSFAMREAILKEQEQEIVQMKKRIELFPQELSDAIDKKAQEITQNLTNSFAHEKAIAEKESTAMIHLLELKIANLEERLNISSQEIISLKQQSEEANAKAQALAMKAIDRPTTIVTAPQQSSHSQTT